MSSLFVTLRWHVIKNNIIGSFIIYIFLKSLLQRVFILVESFNWIRVKATLHRFYLICRTWIQSIINSWRNLLPIIWISCCSLLRTWHSWKLNLYRCILHFIVFNIRQRTQFTTFLHMQCSFKTNWWNGLSVLLSDI